MKKTFTILSLVISLITFAWSFAQEKNIIPGELLIQFRHETNIEQFKNSFMQYDIESSKLLSRRLNIWLMKYNVNKIRGIEILNEVKNNFAVKEAQFNHYIELREGKLSEPEFNESLNQTNIFPDDSRFNEQWALNNTGQTGGLVDADIDAPEAWDFATGGLTTLGDTIVVAIIDGGCSLNHPDLNYWINRAEIPNNGIDDDANGYIDDYRGWNAYDSNGDIESDDHGTHVSGIAGAKGNNGIGVTGVNWNVKIMPIGGSTGIESIVIEAYGYVLEMRSLYNETNGAEGAFVVSTNASFGVDHGQPEDYPLWCAIYDSLGMQGVLSCGATANANWNIDIEGDIPTACPSPWLISVTNTTHSDTKNSGAGYGLTTIDLGAPGTNILSTVPGNSYDLKTGTSMATPTVTGAIALMYAAANSSLMESYKEDPSVGAITFRDFLFAGTDSVASLNGITVTGGRLNVLNAIMPLLSPPDSTPPVTVIDLSTVDTTSNSLTLNWTAPLDTTQNGVIGYDIRISSSPIVDSAAFYNAGQIEFPGTPDTAGSIESLLIEDLEFNTTYYFALKARDLWNNTSEISNNASGTTYGAPIVSVDPASLHEVLFDNLTVEDTLTLSNISEDNSTLDYEITLENNTFPEGKVKLIQKPKNSKERFPTTKDNPKIFYGQSITGSGGPDAFGYSWIDSDEPNGPQFIWEDITTTGTEITGWEAAGSGSTPLDDGFVQLPLGFSFKYYDALYSQIYISTNGFVTFDPVTESWVSNGTIPSSSQPNNIISAFWDDLDGRTRGTVHYRQDGTRFILQYTDWQKYSGSGGTGSFTFQVVLYSSGKIIIYYNNMSGTLNSATIGIENQDGTSGLQVAKDAAYIHNNLALKFSAEPDWLNALPLGGRLYDGNSVDIELQFITEDFPSGSYSMDVVVRSNDPANSVITVPVSMEIEAIPVELTSLSAETDNNNITIKWTTATETNNRGFEIEKRISFKPSREESSGSWEKAGFIDGKGNTTERQSYSFSEKDLRIGKYIYRLKQVDYDGSFEYSNEIELNITAPDEYKLKQNYPNPFNPVTTIEYSLPENAEVTIDIYNSIGELVKTLVNNRIEAGYQKISFDASSLPSGMYIYRLKAKGESGSAISSKKMLLMK